MAGPGMTGGAAAQTLSEENWETLLENIEEQKCTPFLGAGASAPAVRVAKQIARDLAQRYKYPFGDTNDLPAVTQYMAINKYGMLPKKELAKECSGATAPTLVHHVLAELPLPLFITTNYDNLMFQALKERPDKEPQLDFFPWHRSLAQNHKSVLGRKSRPYHPTVERPLVYHLHGHCATPESMVVTEDDYLAYLTSIAGYPGTQRPSLPSAIGAAFARNCVLFIGYSLYDWTFRVMFRAIMESITAQVRMPSVSVQLPREDTPAADRAAALEYLRSCHSSQLRLNPLFVYWGDALEFATELRERWNHYKERRK